MQRFKNSDIPIWVNVLQVLLTLIMLGQVYMYFFDHDLLSATGVVIYGTPDLNLVYEMGGRTLTMAAASIFVLIMQDTRQFLVVLFMNILREGVETIIDPLFRRHREFKGNLEFRDVWPWWCQLRRNPWSRRHHEAAP